MHASVSAAADLPRTRSRSASDGCGMLAFQLPLVALARAFGRLASGGLGPGGERVSEAIAPIRRSWPSRARWTPS